jgi:hypothetical protein
VPGVDELLASAEELPFSVEGLGGLGFLFAGERLLDAEPGE